MLKDIIHIENCRKDFPLLMDSQKQLVFLDSAASSQKPTEVIDAITHFYSNDYANIHRGIYQLSVTATENYEASRETVRAFINARSSSEIVWTSGTTQAINLVAMCLSHNWQKDDEVILSEMEHHANIVPWYFLKNKLGIQLKIIPVLDDGSLDMEVYEKLFSAKTKLVAITHVSNVLGTINPIEPIIAIAHKHGAKVLVDGAQAVPHLTINVQTLDCDFYVFSSHKMYGPTGVGVLYGKKQLLDAMPPYQGGGDMIETVDFDHITFAKTPHKFEAGTPPIVSVIGLNSAINYITRIGIEKIHAHEKKLLAYANQKLNEISGLRIIGTNPDKIGVISFVLAGIHAHDIGTILDNQHIAVRAGHHCAMPLMKRFSVPATVRASLALYNCEADIDALVRGLLLAKQVFLCH